MKKIKIFLKFAFSSLLVVGILFCYMQWQQMKETRKQDKIQDLIDKELLGESDPVDTGSDTIGDINIGEIISNSIIDSVEVPTFLEIEMIDSSTFTATVDGVISTFHLIGVSGDGDVDAVKTILANIVNGQISYDTMEVRKGIQQIYLWEGEIGNTDKMINLQIIKKRICATTYNGTSYAESPNIKYSHKFVEASK